MIAAGKCLNAKCCVYKTGKAKDIRFSTLEAICKVPNCQPRNLLEYKNV